LGPYRTRFRKYGGNAAELSQLAGKECKICPIARNNGQVKADLPFKNLLMARGVRRVIQGQCKFGSRDD
jgi:hypothetical protein